VPVIIWINGGFGAGKTTLAKELHRRLPEAVVYNPEDAGLMLWKWMRPNGDFQHLPSWRELVIATAHSLRRHHADTLIVPMSLIRDVYRAGIFDGLADVGELALHVFLEADADVLRERLNARVTKPGRDWDQVARESGMTGVDEMVAAAARQPTGTLLLRSDRLTPPNWPTKSWPRPGCARITETASGGHRQDRWTQKRPRVCHTSSGASPCHIHVEPATR
jgi:AAA domain